ncbi:hypothetical protein NKH18_38305 [Streptomyces sp. M10(2022)]
MLDHGFVDAVRSGRVEPVGAVQAFDGPDVVLADGTRLRPDTVIAATGYRPNLHDLVGPWAYSTRTGNPRRRGTASSRSRAPVLRRIHQSLTGVLRQAGIEARASPKRYDARPCEPPSRPRVGDRTADTPPEDTLQADEASEARTFSGVAP